MQKVLDPKPIYLDHASSTKPFLSVIEATQQWLPVFYANPDANHPLGFEIKREMDKSRAMIAKHFSVSAKEVIFTQGGSSAMNMAIKGIALAQKNKKNHIITLATEHKCVLLSVAWCQEFLHYNVTILPVDKHGAIDIDELKAAITDQTALIAIMAVNNETGWIHPIKAIKDHCLTIYPRPLLVVDAVAAIGKIDDPLSYLGDITGFASHKFGGLAGSGFLIKREKVTIKPLISGGQQEFGVVAGTPFAIGAITTALALECALKQQQATKSTIQACWQYLSDSLTALGFELLSYPGQSIYICSFLTKTMNNATLLNGLASKGVYVSASAACASDQKTPSHVALAMGVSPKQAHTMIRVSFGYDTTIEHVKHCVQAIKEVMAYVG